MLICLLVNNPDKVFPNIIATKTKTRMPTAVPLKMDKKLYLLVIKIVAICDLSPTLARK